MSKIRDFWRGIANDISKVHVRAAFSDMEKRIGHIFGHHGRDDAPQTPKRDHPGLEKVKGRAAFADVEHRVNKVLDKHDEHREQQQSAGEE